MIVTCEHGGNSVPPEYSYLFASPGAQADLRSHRGYDPGALDAANFVAKHFGVTLISSTVTRLLVDLNRSEDNVDLLSKYSRGLDADARARLVECRYRPYRDQVLHQVKASIAENGFALHLSMHTFTPKFRGTRRGVDFGILFDPERTREAEISRRWCESLQTRLPRSRVRENEPYLGTDDGLTTWLRTQFDASGYVGIEIEIVNSIARKTVDRQKRLFDALVESVRRLD